MPFKEGGTCPKVGLRVAKILSSRCLARTLSGELSVLKSGKSPVNVLSAIPSLFSRGSGCWADEHSSPLPMSQGKVSHF